MAWSDARGDLSEAAQALSPAALVSSPAVEDSSDECCSGAAQKLMDYREKRAGWAQNFTDNTEKDDGNLQSLGSKPQSLGSKPQRPDGEARRLGGKPRRPAGRLAGRTAGAEGHGAGAAGRAGPRSLNPASDDAKGAPPVLKRRSPAMTDAPSRSRWSSV